jgi:hypothetical protein
MLTEIESEFEDEGAGRRLMGLSKDWGAGTSKTLIFNTKIIQKNNHILPTP